MRKHIFVKTIRLFIAILIASVLVISPWSAVAMSLSLSTIDVSLDEKIREIVREVTDPEMTDFEKNLLLA